VSDFFEPPPRYEPPTRKDWQGPPRASVPVTVPIERIVGRSDSAVLYLAAIAAYPKGFELDLCAAVAPGSELDPFGFEPQAASHRSGELVPALLRFGLAFADGSKATNTGAYLTWDEDNEEPTAPVLSGRNGSGWADTWLHHFWIWPLPPRGRLEFVCEWPAAGIPLIRTELDVDPILDAAARVS
jgi:hypothetical protein